MLALLLIRIRDKFLLTMATFTDATGIFRQHAELAEPQGDILAKLDIPTPKKIVEGSPAAEA